VVVDGTRSGSSGEDGTVPCKRSNSSFMSSEDVEALLVLGIPEFDGSIVHSDGKVVSISSPVDGRDRVVFLASHQSVGSSSGSIKDVDGISQTNSDDILGAPVQDVQIVVIGEVGSIQNLDGLIRDLSSGSLLGSSNVGREEDSVGVDMSLGSRGSLGFEGQNLGVHLSIEEGFSESLVVFVGSGVNVLLGQMEVADFHIHGASGGDETISSSGSST